jgi:3-hydroxyisobutyrate dehydrogenase-like beta-hydroxyacid dehydrogenase
MMPAHVQFRQSAVIRGKLPIEPLPREGSNRQARFRSDTLVRASDEREIADMDVGFIGLGHMGQAMARNLLKAGHRLVVYNRTRSRAETLAAEGAAMADRPADACRGDAVITMLADDQAVESVIFGADNILAALAPGKAHISMSTISVALSQRLAEAHGRAGQTYLAAPVFGRPDVAAAGKLFVVAGGAADAVARHQTLFDAIGQRTFVIGERPEAANVVKLSGNFLITSVLESLGEAFALIRKWDIDQQRYLEILTNSLFSAPIYKTYGPIIAAQRYEPAGFKLSLGLKDVRLALAAAEAKNMPMPVASLVRDHFLAAVAHGEADSDWSALARVAARNAGL